MKYLLYLSIVLGLLACDSSDDKNPLPSRNLDISDDSGPPTILAPFNYELRASREADRTELDYESTAVDVDGRQVFRAVGNEAIFATSLLQVDTSKNYRLSGLFQAKGAEASRIYLGLVCYDKDQEEIHSYRVFRVGAPRKILSFTNSSLGLDSVPSDWYGPTVYAYYRFIGFYFDGDTSKLPDYVHQGPKETGAYTEIKSASLELNEDLPAEILSKINIDTVVHNQRRGSTYTYLAALGDYIEPDGAWWKYSGEITGETFENTRDTFRTGTKYVKLIIFANYGQFEEDTDLWFDELKFEELD